MSNDWSIRRRIFGSWLLMLVIVCAAVYVGVNGISKRSLFRAQDSDLKALSLVILDSVVSTSSGITFDLPHSAFEVLAYSAPERIFYQVSANGRVLAGYDDLPREPSSSLDVEFQTADYRSEVTRFVFASKTFGSTAKKRVIVVIGQTRSSYMAFASEIANYIAIIVLVAFICLAVWAELSLRYSLRPFFAIESNLLSRKSDDFSPIPSGTPVEITKLVDSLNGTFEKHRSLLEQNRAFIAEATHQVKTPIAALVTMAELLEKDAPPALKVSVHNLIIRSRYASKLASQLLTRASLTYRGMLDVKAEIKVSNIVESVQKALDPVAERKDIEIQIELPEKSPLIVGDRVAIREALVCLVDNALEYSPVLSDVCVRVFEDGDQVIVEVFDQGPGFSEDPSILMSAFKGEGRHASNVGLGLAIVKGVAENHQAVFELENMENGGALCRLRFSSV